MKKVLASLLAMILVSIIGIPAAARNFAPIGVNPEIEDKVAFMVQDLRNGSPFTSLIRRETPDDQLATLGNRWCLDFEVGNCLLEPGYTIQGSAILPVCEGSETNCIVGLSLTSSGSQEVKAKQILGLEKGFEFDALETLETPRGAEPSLWEADGAPHSGGNSRYIVSVNIRFRIVDGRVVQYDALSAAIYPAVELSAANFKPVGISTRQVGGATVWNTDNGARGDVECALTTTGKCWTRDEFAPGVKAKLTLRVTDKIGGWLHGRLAEPNVSITTAGAGVNQVSVEAKPVDVPIMYAETKYSVLEPGVKRIVDFPFQTGGVNSGKRWAMIPSWRPEARTMIAKYSAEARDTAAAVYSSWQFNTISTEQGASGCFSKPGLVGLVTTNAMAYDEFAPVFKGGSLDYSVAGLHYLPDGQKALGVYDLVVRSDVARCLYGFSKAPVSAKVSVLTSGGDTVVATTQVSEKDGWLKLAAYGFTFSEKKISVKVIQPQSLRLDRFKQGVWKLSAIQQSQLQSFSILSDGSSKVICSATYMGSKNRTNALAQARAACDFVAKRTAGVKTEIKALPVKRSSDALRVDLKSS